MSSQSGKPELPKLDLWDKGSYAELSQRPNPDGLALQFIPKLVLVAHAITSHKGRYPTEDEFLEIRGMAITMAVPSDEVPKGDPFTYSEFMDLMRSATAIERQEKEPTPTGFAALMLLWISRVRDTLAWIFQKRN